MKSNDRFGRIDALCLGALLWAAGVLATNSYSRIPGWDLSPLLGWSGEGSLTPGQAMIFIGIAMGAAVGLWLRNQSGGTLCAVLWCVGAVGVLAHGLFLTPLVGAVGPNAPRGDLNSLIIGGSWFAGLTGAWAIATSRNRHATLHVCLSTACALMCVIAAKALFERFVEYPQMIAAYRETPEATQLAQGMEPGSARALAYERRILGGHPTGWFGLSNVLASFIGAAFLICLGITADLWREHRKTGSASGVPGAAALFTCVFAVVLWLTGSSAAIGLVAVMLVLLGSYALVPRVRVIAIHHPTSLLLFPAITVLALVVGRGVFFGEGGERSILFRWHYWSGTVRVWWESMLFGAGPSGFQGAYTRLKPSISPENVHSPHALFADWVGTLGMFGLVWLAGLLVWFWHAKSSPRVTPAWSNGPRESRVVPIGILMFPLAVASSVVITSAIIQWPIWSVAPDLVVVILLGLAAGGVLAWLVGLSISHGGQMLRMSMLAAAALLLAHGMFDVTPVRTGSAVLFWVMLGMAIPVSVRSHPRLSRFCVGMPGMVAMLLLGIGLHQSLRVDAQLLRAAETSVALSAGTGQESGRRIAAEADAHFRRAVDRAFPAWQEVDMEYLTMRASLAPLLAGAKPTLLELGKGVTDRWPGSVFAHARVMAVFASYPVGTPARSLATQSALRVAELSPHDAGPAYNAFSHLLAAGDETAAKQWGEAAIRNSRQARMDRLAGLNEAQFRHIGRVFPGLVPAEFSDLLGTGAEDDLADLPTEE